MVILKCTLTDKAMCCGAISDMAYSVLVCAVKPLIIGLLYDREAA